MRGVYRHGPFNDLTFRRLMMNTTRVAMALCGLLLAMGAGGASASLAAAQFKAVVPAAAQLARHGHDDVGCDDHGSDRCAARDGGAQVARHGHGRDDAGCDDHGTDLCVAREGSRES
jgi:hypothetical protein